MLHAAIRDALHVCYVALMPVPIGHVEFWLRFALTGDPEPMYTALAYEIATPPFTQAQAEICIDRMQDLIRARVCDDYTLDGGFALVGNDGGDLRYDVTQAQAGQVVAQPLPQNCAVLLSKRTAVGGRANRGRMYVPGISGASVSPSGVLDGTTITNWQTTCSALMLSGMGAAGSNVLSPVLLHKSNAAAPTDLTVLDVSNRIATQRRRLRP